MSDAAFAAPRRASLAHSSALRLLALLAALDARALVFSVAGLGILAWILPWNGLFLLLVPACALAATAVYVMPRGRAALAAYGFFVLTWAVSRLCLYLFEHPGAFGPALEGALLLGCRLFTLLGLALAVPLAVTPLTLGRVLSWSLAWLVRLESAVCFGLFRGKIKPLLGEGVWRAALALALMMAFFPRALGALSDLRRSLRLRAPKLPLHRRFTLLALAALRVLSVQTWDMTLAIASRGVYKPEPWRWRS